MHGKVRIGRCLLPVVLVLSCGWVLADESGIIRNGKTPSAKGQVLELKETLRVTADDDENDHFIWPGVGTNVSVDAKGHMFVADVANKRVIEIDVDGKFVRQIGGPGQGPGEFQRLLGFQILEDGTAVAIENLGILTTFTWFDKNMEYVDRKAHTNLQVILQGGRFSPDGKRLGGIYAAVDQGSRKTMVHFGLLSRELEVEKSLVSFETPLPDPSRVRDPEFWVEMLSNNFQKASKGLVGFMAMDQGNHVYTAVAGKYEVTKWSPELEKLMVFTKEYDPIPLSEEEIKAMTQPIADAVVQNLPPQLAQIVTKNVIERAIEKADFPPAMNPINGLAVMDDGHILVIHEASMASGKAKLDMFGPDGRFKGNLTVPVAAIQNMIFHQGHLYLIDTDDAEENMLVRYKYTWSAP